MDTVKTPTIAHSIVENAELPASLMTFAAKEAVPMKLFAPVDPSVTLPEYLGVEPGRHVVELKKTPTAQTQPHPFLIVAPVELLVVLSGRPAVLHLMTVTDVSM